MNNAPQDQMKEKLMASGIPAKEVRCYGSQIMVTAHSLDAANEWVSLLQSFAGTVRKPWATTDDAPGSKRGWVKVWRVWGTI